MLQVQLFDHRTILSDTLLGEASYPLRFFARSHANAYPENQVRRKYKRESVMLTKAVVGSIRSPREGPSDRDRKVHTRGM